MSKFGIYIVPWHCLEFGTLEDNDGEEGGGGDIGDTDPLAAMACGHPVGFSFFADKGALNCWETEHPNMYVYIQYIVVYIYMNTYTYMYMYV